jgi:potassium/hydrogen antiporter
MTSAIIIAICSLLLLAYIFDLTSSKTRIPSVILLLLLGFMVRQGAELVQVSLPDFQLILPVFGTIGLILIVLEGSLELELNRSKGRLIWKSFLGALLPILVLAFGLSYAFNEMGAYSLKISLMNALPLCVISSAIAIPSVRNLTTHQKEFVIYESSLSDILGVIIFNFVIFNENFDFTSVGHFMLQLLTILIVSFIATIALAFLLNRIDHPIKFIPIILLVILIYIISKEFHLPSLLFILLFGLCLGNLDELKKIKWIEKFKPEKLDGEVKKFKELTVEATFLVRALFFLLFGYLMNTEEILNLKTLPWAVGIVMAILLFRSVQLKLSSFPLRPLVFVAPRGLITILLFLSIDKSLTISLVNKSLIIQVIILTALVMMLGLMFSKPEVKTETD